MLLSSLKAGITFDILASLPHLSSVPSSVAGSSQHICQWFDDKYWNEMKLWGLYVFRISCCLQCFPFIKLSLPISKNALCTFFYVGGEKKSKYLICKSFVGSWFSPGGQWYNGFKSLALPLCGYFLTYWASDSSTLNWIPVLVHLTEYTWLCFVICLGARENGAPRIIRKWRDVAWLLPTLLFCGTFPIFMGYLVSVKIFLEKPNRIIMDHFLAFFFVSSKYSAQIQRSRFLHKRGE